MGIPKRLYYEGILVIIMDFLVAGSSRAANSGKITMRLVISVGIVLTVSRKLF